VNWIFDADIRSFFDSVSWEWLVGFLEHRIRDSRMIRLIQKWLKAGVLEEGVVSVSDRGTGQGSVISPLLANVYLHYTFDLWAERWRRRQATGDMIIVRYADTWSWALSMRVTPAASGTQCASGCRSFRCRCTRTRPD
jgi:RNA-directed DNA polymerase